MKPFDVGLGYNLESVRWVREVLADQYQRIKDTDTNLANSIFAVLFAEGGLEAALRSGAVHLSVGSDSITIAIEPLTTWVKLYYKID